MKEDAAKSKVATNTTESRAESRAAGGEQPAPATYAQIVERLETLVQAMEAGELPLEASLETFAEGVQLIKQGEKILAEAEQRIEQLLASGEVAPLHLPGT
ncbi:MAG: exodeoxyribonuclease VII small subunit [Cystobacterineae bacterium]|nr:exodeoxyribonuclease VII small subunit [Cystobacterineae bacterium]